MRQDLDALFAWPFENALTINVGKYTEVAIGRTAQAIAYIIICNILTSAKQVKDLSMLVQKSLSNLWKLGKAAVVSVSKP